MPERNRARRNRERSSIGSLARSSQMTKEVPRHSPSTTSPMINDDVQPYEFPNEMAESTATTAGKNKARPL